MFASAVVVAGVGMFGSVAHAGSVSSAGAPLASIHQIRNGTLVVGFDSSTGRPGPTSVSWGNRTILQSSSDASALSMSWSLRGALFGGAKPTASSQSNQTDGTAEVVSAGPTTDGSWLETLRYNALGVTVARTWRIDAARQEVICSVRVVATSPANPLGNPTLLEAWIQANLHDVPDATGMTARYFSPHPQAQFDIDCCPGCVFEGGAHVAGQPAGLISNVYAPLHTAAAGVYDRVRGWGAATWLSGVGGGYNTWTIASEGNFDLAAASATYNPRVCAGQWRHYLFRGFTEDAEAMDRGFEFRLTLFDGEPMSFLSAAADLPARQVLVKKRVHPDPSSTLPNANALVMFPYYAPGATGSSQDASEQLLKQLQRVSVASNATVIAVLVLFTDGFQAGNFPRLNNSGLSAAGALSRLAAAKYPGVRLVSYNIMMVGVSSTVWRDHPDFVSFDRYGTPVVDTPGERLSLDLASADAREYYRSNILATLSAMNASGVYLDFGVLAYGTPNWRAARVATSFDYLQFEESISTGIQTWGLPRRGVLVANSPGNLLADANFNELGPGVWTNPKAISMSLQEGKRFTPPGAMPSHIYCYDKRFFVAFGAATGSAPAFRPDNATQFDVRAIADEQIGAFLSCHSYQLLLPRRVSLVACCNYALAT